MPERLVLRRIQYSLRIFGQLGLLGSRGLGHELVNFLGDYGIIFFNNDSVVLLNDNGVIVELFGLFALFCITLYYYSIIYDCIVTASKHVHELIGGALLSGSLLSFLGGRTRGLLVLG